VEKIERPLLYAEGPLIEGKKREGNRKRNKGGCWQSMKKMKHGEGTLRVLGTKDQIEETTTEERGNKGYMKKFFSYLKWERKERAKDVVTSFRSLHHAIRGSPRRRGNERPSNNPGFKRKKNGGKGGTIRYPYHFDREGEGEKTPPRV